MKITTQHTHRIFFFIGVIVFCSIWHIKVDAAPRPIECNIIYTMDGEKPITRGPFLLHDQSPYTESFGPIVDVTLTLVRDNEFNIDGTPRIDVAIEGPPGAVNKIADKSLWYAHCRQQHPDWSDAWIGDYTVQGNHIDISCHAMVPVIDSEYSVRHPII